MKSFLLSLLAGVAVAAKRSYHSELADVPCSSIGGGNCNSPSDITTANNAADPACLDDFNWTSVGNPFGQLGVPTGIGRGCDWVGSNPNEYRCTSVDADGVPAYDACPCAQCATFDHTTDSITDHFVEPTCLENSDWISIGNPFAVDGTTGIGKGCDWVGLNPNEFRCENVDANGVPAYNACFCSKCAA